MRKEAHLFMTVNVILEESFENYQGNDLFNPERTYYHVFRMRKVTTFIHMLKVIADYFKRGKEQVRGWPLEYRSNATFRPNVLTETHRSIWESSERSNPWTVFVEMAPSESLNPLPPYDVTKDLLVFFKYYDRAEERLRYCGHAYLQIESNLEGVIPLLNERAGLPADTKLVLYEEIRPYMIEQITNLTDPIKEAIEEYMNGDIIIFEKDEETDRPNCIEFFKELFFKLQVTFVNKCICNDLGFTMTLSSRLKYDQFAAVVAEKLGTRPELLQFFTHQK